MANFSFSQLKPKALTVNNIATAYTEKKIIQRSMLNSQTSIITCSTEKKYIYTYKKYNKLTENRFSVRVVCSFHCKCSFVCSFHCKWDKCM